MLTSDKKEELLSKNWSFQNYNDWPKKFPQCNSRRAVVVAPINIDISKVSPCHELCRFGMQYKPSSCSAAIKNNMPTIYFDPTCIVKFRNDFFYLRKMSMHYPSMHTVNGEQYDMEVLLYHNRNKTTDADGGIIVSLLFKKGNDYGPVNEFFNEFINQVPTVEVDDDTEIEIPVSASWNPDKLYPKSKSFFWYEGALPFPPCSAGWNIIVFEQIQDISQNIIDTLRFVIGVDNVNNRPIQKPTKSTTVFYNTDTDFAILASDNNNASQRGITNEIAVQELQRVKSTGFLQRNFLTIKGVLITIILLLMLVVALKLAKYMVEHDVLNRFIVAQVVKRNTRIGEKQREEAIASGEYYQGQQQPVEYAANNGEMNGNMLSNNGATMLMTNSNQTRGMDLLAPTNT